MGGLLGELGDAGTDDVAGDVAVGRAVDAAVGDGFVDTDGGMAHGWTPYLLNGFL